MGSQFKLSSGKGGFKASTPKTSFGGGNSMQNQLMAYMLSQQKSQNAGQTVEGAMNSFQGQPPAGSKLSSSGGVEVPLNRELSAEELAAITAERVFNPTAEEIKKLTEDGVFDATMTKGIPLVENIERTYRQWSAGQPNALLTSLDPKLQEVQGKISSIRRYVFGEGGKQLTPYEAGIVNALIKPTGKSDEQYVTDLDEALRLINEKSNLAKGGSLAPPLGSPIPGMSGSKPQQAQNQNSGFEQERQQAIQAIQKGAPEAKVRDVFRSRTGQEL